ncbi:hypothetical protein ES703_55968 [subsurface metagenome]
MAIKYYTCFGPQNRVTDVMLNVVNPLGVDIAAAQIRPHDGGVNPMFTAHGSVDALCDITWVLRANKEVYHPMKITPSALAIIRSAQLRTILDGTPYLGNRIYLVSLNAYPLIYADYELVEDTDMINDDITGADMCPYHREFLPGAIETFDPANMSGIFIQYDERNTYVASDVRDWVALGNVFVNFIGYTRKYNGGGEAVGTVSVSIGNLIRTIKDDICLRPLDGGVPTEYTVTRAGSRNDWSTLPTQAGWTTSVLLAYVVGGVEHPFLIEMKHDASGGVLISLAGSTSPDRVLMPGWYYPIVMLQYALGKAGYLGAVPAYVQE